MKEAFESNECGLSPCGADGNEDENEAERLRAIRDPGQPSAAEIGEHNLAHPFFSPWCAACVKAKAKIRPSLTVEEQFAENVLPRARLGYMLLTERVEEVVGDEGEGTSETPESIMTVLVMQ